MKSGTILDGVRTVAAFQDGGISASAQALL
jgi:hypothetical protein